MSTFSKIFVQLRSNTNLFLHHVICVIKKNPFSVLISITLKISNPPPPLLGQIQLISILIKSPFHQLNTTTGRRCGKFAHDGTWRAPRFQFKISSVHPLPPAVAKTNKEEPGGNGSDGVYRSSRFKWTNNKRYNAFSFGHGPNSGTFRTKKLKGEGSCSTPFVVNDRGKRFRPDL